MGKSQLILFLPVFLISVMASSQSENDSLIAELDRTIKHHQQYEQVKNFRLDSLKGLLLNPGNSIEQTYLLNNQLYFENKSYLFDSALHYLNQNQTLAEKSQNPEWLYDNLLNHASLLASAGMFMESLDILNRIVQNKLPTRLQPQYNFTFENVYNGLANYSNDSHYAPVYKKKATFYRLLNLEAFHPGSIPFLLSNAFNQIENGQLDSAENTLTLMFHNTGKTPVNEPIIPFLLADVYKKQGKLALQKKYLTLAAIGDIQLTRKENVALRELSLFLYNEADFERAYQYLQFALADARRYNARQRMVEISDIQPIINAAYEKQKENQQLLLERFLVVTSILSVLLIIAVVSIYKQMQKVSRGEKKLNAANTSLKLANQNLNSANGTLKHLNEELQGVNGQLFNLNNELEKTNKSLEEANRIKEEYIGFFFNINSNFYQKIERFKKMIEQKITARKFNEVRKVLDNLNVRTEKEDLLQNFDEVFLKLFPGFIAEYNSLFGPEDGVNLKENELMNTDLRIFALIRIGITDNEKIAQILNYSVSTIYNYKTKIKMKAKVPKDEFEKKLMEVSSV